MWTCVTNLTRSKGNEKDIARDLLLFITAYLPLYAGENLPKRLVPRQPAENGRTMVRQDLHVIGHSLGAQSAMLIAAHAPDVFASLTVFDPAMIPNGPIREAFTKYPKDVLCTNLKFKYPNRESLLAGIRKNRRTKGWDERVVQLFADYGAVIDASKGTAQLTANPRLEWALYYDQETPTQCYDRLRDIEVPLNVVMPARPFAVPKKMLERNLARNSNVIRLSWVPETTHQLPFEKIEECTGFVVAWLKDVTKDQRAKM